LRASVPPQQASVKITERTHEEPKEALNADSAIGYITPKDTLAGHQQEIQPDRVRKPGVEAAREQQKNPRQRAA
jgi:hypothetical protein